MGINYEININRQSTELTEKPSNENEQLKLENNVLREKISAMEASIEELITAAVTEAVRLATEPLLEALAKANAEIERLKAIINKNSSNSSKPPSTNGFKNIPNSRVESSKSRGGQGGHPGRRIGLPENIEELEQKGIVERRIIDNTNGSSEYISRYTLDIDVKIVVTEHRYSKASDLPDGLLNEVSYGDNLKAAAILLSSEGMIADKRLTDIVSGLTHGVINLSTGTMCNLRSKFAQELGESGEIEAIEQDLIIGEVMNTDDTSVRSTERIVYPEADENGAKPTLEHAKKKSFRVTIRTYSNERSTRYTVNPKKDQKGVERDGILPKFGHTLVHDHEKKFYNFGNEHGTCCEHLCRDLLGLNDLKKIEWALEMRSFMYGMNEYKKEDLQSDVHSCNPEKLAFFESEYDRLVGQGRTVLEQIEAGGLGYTDLNAMLNRLTDYKDCYMLFMRNYKVPFTNNLAERDLRPEKTKDKVSGPFRSWDGVVVHTNIRSFISTAKKRGKELFSSIASVFKGEPVLR